MTWLRRAEHLILLSGHYPDKCPGAILEPVGRQLAPVTGVQKSEIVYSSPSVVPP